MNKTYDIDAEYDYEYHEGYYTYVYNEDGSINWQETTYTDSYEEIIAETPAYSVTHPTGARISIMVGFNLSK